MAMRLASCRSPRAPPGRGARNPLEVAPPRSHILEGFAQGTRSRAAPASMAARSGAGSGAEHPANPAPARRALSPHPKDDPVFISSAYAQTTVPAAAPESSLIGMLAPVLVFVALYFVMIRPQMKRQKEHRALIEALAKGDEVATSGGVLGRISKLGETFVHVEVASGVEVQVQRSAITQVLPKGTLK